MSEKCRDKVSASYAHYIIYDTYVEAGLHARSIATIHGLNEIAYLIGMDYTFQSPVGYRVSNNASLNVCAFNSLLDSFVRKNKIPCIVRLEHSKVHEGFHELFYAEVKYLTVDDPLTQVLYI